MFELLWFGAIGGAIAAAMIVTWMREKTPLRTVVARLLPVALALALPPIMLRFGVDDSRLPAAILFLLAGILLEPYMQRLVDAWAGPGELPEMYGAQDGYIEPAQPALSAPARTLLGVGATALVVALFALLYFSFAPE